MKKILIFILALIAISACEKEQHDILSEGKMEDVLYDYHKAQAMLDQLAYDDREKMAQAYIDAVFEKNDVTEAEFDSSLVYYNRHADELYDIYNDLRQRMDEENEQLSLTTGNDVMTVFSQNGDTANIWNASRIVVLRHKDGLNYECFTIQADSSFHRQDKFVLVCSSNIITENSTSPDIYMNVGLTINYKDGTSTGTSTRSMNSQDMQLTVNASEGKDIKNVSGYFYYNGTSNIRNIAFISNIGLVRMRTVKEEPKPAEADSVKKDTLPTEAPKRHGEHLTPEQMRMQNQNEHHAEIKAAPDVRTPNSTFKRRRTKKK